MYSMSSKIKTKSKVVLKEYQKHVVLIDSKLKTIKKIKKIKGVAFIVLLCIQLAWHNFYK